MQLRDDLKSDKKIDQNLNILNGVIFRSKCIYLPETVRSAVNPDLHETLSAIIKIKGLERRYVHRPTLNIDIDSLAKNFRMTLIQTGQKLYQLTQHHLLLQASEF